MLALGLERRGMLALGIGGGQGLVELVPGTTYTNNGLAKSAGTTSNMLVSGDGVLERCLYPSPCVCLEV